MAAAGGGPGPGPGPGGPGGAGAAGGGRKPGSPRDAEAEVWSRRVRELVSAEPANRLCFECGQRGVTYVDITVGSLVCTGCSGALRGLNPPHRVKSISMTTFTEAEVQFLQARGNEACRRVWLGAADPRAAPLPDSRDPQKVKEFLQEKYEKKRWYVSPERAKAAAASSLPGQSSAAEAAPAQTLLGEAPGQPRPAQQRPPPPAKKASTDLLADIGGDPFAAPQPAPAFAAFPAFPGQAPAHAAFANFDAFGAGPGAAAFGGAAAPFPPLPAPTGGAAVPGGPAPAGPPEVGGAAASLFGTLSHPPPPPLPHGAPTNPFAAPQPARPGTNPFQSNGPAPGAAFAVGSPAAFVAPQVSPLPGAFPAAFQPSLFAPAAPPGQQHNGSGFGGFGATKAGQPVGVSTNPFVTVPPAPFVIKHPATNPFL